MVEQLATLLIPLGCGCVLPIVIVWLAIRAQMNETNQRTQIVLAAIEKNPDMSVEELMKSMTPKKKLLKEKLLAKLQWGCLAVFLGIGMIGLDIYFIVWQNGKTPLGILGVVLLAAGIAFLVSYYVGKRMLAGEIEAEEQRLTAPANSQ